MSGPAPSDAPPPATDRSGSGPEPSRTPQHPARNALLDFWGPVLVTLALYLGIRHFLAEARYIPSGSMLPGLQIQDRLLVEKLSYRGRAPRRGEIVVFNSPYAFDPALRQDSQPGALRCLLANLPLVGSVPGVHHPACDAYIKRVVAVSGDRVSVNPRGEVTINGRPLPEPYVDQYCPVSSEGVGPCQTINGVVPEGHVLTLGDNRANSWDGRFWPGGHFLPEEEIIGRAVWRFWPFQRAGSLVSGDPLKAGS